MKQINVCLLVIFLNNALLSSNSYAQNPLPLLKDYQYKTDNKIDLKGEFSKSDYNLSCTNIFFTYEKNPFYNQTFNPAKIMLFKIGYEHLKQFKINDSMSGVFTFPLQKDDKLTNKKIVLCHLIKGELKEKKLKIKYYNTSISDSAITFKIDNIESFKNSIIRIYWTTKSEKFHRLHIPPEQTNDKANYVFLSIPEVFNYNLLSEDLELINIHHGDMYLKQFSYNISRLVTELSVINTTYKWKKTSISTEINFPLAYINLPERVGSSAEEIMGQ